MRVKNAALLSDAPVCFPPPNHPAELILPMLADAEGDKIQNRKKSERKFRKFRAVKRLPSRPFATFFIY